MKRLLLVRSVAFLFILLIFVSGTYLFAQGRSYKAKERIHQVKLIKLLDILDLDDKTSEKFISKYMGLEKDLEKQRKQMDSSLDELEMSINKGEKKDKISEKTKKVMEQSKKFCNLMDERLLAVKPLLNDEQFAKLVLFEYKFAKEFQRMLIERRNRGGGPPHRGRGMGNFPDANE